MVADRRLGEVEQRDQFADANLAGIPSQHVDELEPNRVAERLGDFGHSDRLLALDLGIHDRLAAALAGRPLALRSQFEWDGHTRTVSMFTD